MGALLLHVTDPHIAAEGTPLRRDDHKVRIPEIEHGSREDALDLMLARLAERLGHEQKLLDGVLFTGDAQDRGRAGGHELLLRILLDRLGPLGITPGLIVATPGNHDVPRATAPGSADRYKVFVETWRAAGCVTPWLDGVDTSTSSQQHALVAPDQSWAIYPINSCNWSHVTSVLPPPLSEAWARIPTLLAPDNPTLQHELGEQLEALARYDMARVSKEQLEVLRSIVASTSAPSQGAQLRIALMHHHLRSPSLREEVKPFADITNLEQVRAFFRGSGINAVDVPPAI